MVAVLNVAASAAEYVTWSGEPFGRATRRRYGVFRTMGQALAFLGRERVPTSAALVAASEGAEQDTSEEPEWERSQR